MPEVIIHDSERRKRKPSAARRKGHRLRAA